jgi:hypothetical protein
MEIIGITNNLNFAISTNRLKMMTKKKTSALKRFKFIWALPVLALLLFAFAEPKYSLKEHEQKTISEPASEIKTDKTIKVAGIVFDEEGDPLPGTSVVVKGGTVGTVVDRDGTFALEISENSDIVLSFVGKETIVVPYSELISGKEKKGAFTSKYVMKDAVQLIYNPNYSGEQMVPPPPPPPPSPKEKAAEPANGEAPPPPPPPVKNEQEVFFIVEDMPKYPGGFKALQEYVEKMQQKMAEGKNIKGKAKLSFTVNAKGKVTDVKVVEKENDGVAKGAVAIASQMPDWTPGKQRGKAVPVKYLLPVEFK